MDDFAANVKQKLNSIISEMAEKHWLFSNNPGHNTGINTLLFLIYYNLKSHKKKGQKKQIFSYPNNQIILNHHF